MRKKISLSLIAVFVFSLFIMQGCGKKEETDVIKIGAILPLTGKLSFYGNEVKDALTIVKEKEKNLKIQFLYEDSQSKASNAVTIFNKLSMENTMPLIISCNSPLSIPLRPLAEKNKKVLLALVTGARDFGVANKWSFRDAINQDQEGVALARYIIEKTDKRNACNFVVNDDYGLGGAESFTSKLEELGGNVVAQETFEMNDRDMRTSIIKLLNSNPDFIYIVGREQTIISSINQIREQNENILIVTSDAFDSPNVQKGVGENAKGIIYASYYNNLESNEAKTFIELFETKFNRRPGIYAIDAYVAGKYILKLVQDTGIDSHKLRDELSNMEYVSEIKGKLHVSVKRDVISPIAIYKVNSKFEKIVIHVVI